MIPAEIQQMIRASAAVAQHMPTPTWTCRACGEPWVCAARRANLPIEFSGRPAELAALLAAYHDGMLRSDISADVAWSRAIGWA